MGEKKYRIKWRSSDGSLKTIWCDTKQEALAEIDDKLCISQLVTIAIVNKKPKAE